jgi:hypothetical protein
LHPLGVVVDTHLQEYAKKQSSYVKNSFQLKELLEALPPLPNNAVLITADATDMYTNINTDHGIHNRTHTTMNEKVMNLYLYSSPHSTHPPGVLYGLIVGSLYRILTLCSNRADAIPMAQHFLRRLAARGYRRSKLNELFTKAFAYLTKPPAPATPAPTPDPSDGELDAHNDIHFIVPYHPQNPSCKELQRLWRNTVFEPPASALSTKSKTRKTKFLFSVA